MNENPFGEQEKYFIKVEPYWNVNKTTKKIYLKKLKIKVEPYWNVNA